MQNGSLNCFFEIEFYLLENKTSFLYQWLRALASLRNRKWPIICSVFCLFVSVSRGECENSLQRWMPRPLL